MSDVIPENPALWAKHQVAPVSAHDLVAKIQAAFQMQFPEAAAQLAADPGLPEVLWFIQWVSHQRGGLALFASDLLKAHASQIGTGLMHRLRIHGRPSLKPEEALAIWATLPPGARSMPVLSRDAVRLWRILETEEIQVGRTALAENPSAASELVRNFTPDYFVALVTRAAMAELPRDLADICRNPESVFPDPPADELSVVKILDGGFQDNLIPGRWEAPRFWYLSDPTAAVRQQLARHQVAEAARIAKTSVASLVFDELELGRSERIPVLILGESRFGKTKAAEVWCRMRPGLARLVTIPETAREWDFLVAHADALGLPCAPGVSVTSLRNSIQYCVRNSGLFFAYDEAHYLVPTSYGRRTAPRRLNWIRSHIIDRGLGCAFLATQQAYTGAVNRFVRHTGYVMEQWIGRMARPLTLPQELELEDLMAVARTKFPEMPAKLVEYMANRATAAEGYLANLETLAHYTRHYANQAGRATPSAEDLKRAAARVFGDDIGTRVQAACSSAAEVAHQRRKAPEIGETRTVRPAGIKIEPRGDFGAATPESVSRSYQVPA